jgi:uncharacterized membrane protein
MEIDTYAKRLWALWLALPITALNYWLSWNHLPARIAMHYDTSGRPISWASPDGALTFSLGLLVFVLVVVTGVGYLVAYMRPDRAKPAIILLYIVLGLVWVFLNGFVWFNLAG